MNMPLFTDRTKLYIGALEWYAFEVRVYGKNKRLEYTDFIKAQTAIDKAQAIEIRINNKRFKGIPY